VPEEKNNTTAGHRIRLWRKFLDQGLRVGFVHNYEKLEFLLTFILPRQNTKPLAKTLLDRFGSFNRVVTAPRARLMNVEGVGERVAGFLNMLHEVGLALDEEKLADRDLLTDPELVKAYVRRELAWEEAEYMIAIFLDSKNHLAGMSRAFRGTLDRVAHYPRELAKDALELNAAGMLIAHNHPSGKSEPSQADITHTQHLAKGLEILEIRLLDHLVIGRDGVVSMRDRGLIWR